MRDFHKGILLVVYEERTLSPADTHEDFLLKRIDLQGGERYAKNYPVFMVQ